MRIPKYLSPSQLSLWERCREDYYLQHLADIRQEDIIKTYAMSIGSAFDAYVKAAMHEHLFGTGSNPQFEFEAIFEEQVVPEHRDWGLEHGQYAFECYKLSGAYKDLLRLVDDSQQAPQFEFTIKGDVNKIPLLGKPDLRFVHKDGAHVILDWKVSGYCSKYGASPAKNYQLIRDGWLGWPKQSRSNNTTHKGYKPLSYKGLDINERFLEESNTTWANQIIIYGWLLGEEVGDENVIACIDQLACKPNDDSKKPFIRVAQQRARTSAAYQRELLARLQVCWSSIENNHIFDDLSKSDSQARCEILDRRVEALLLEDDSIKAVKEFVTEQNQIYKF